MEFWRGAPPRSAQTRPTTTAETAARCAPIPSNPPADFTTQCCVSLAVLGPPGFSLRRDRRQLYFHAVVVSRSRKHSIFYPTWASFAR
ncbi:hypothetical protein IG631_23669 [Alternaria alternata]|nr:hypothetical protein IG631_23669 [Alternaria alternata]